MACGLTNEAQARRCFSAVALERRVRLIELEGNMVTVMQTEKTETGLDVAIVADHGGIVAWTYDVTIANKIAWAMNNVWTDSEGNARCSGCDPLPPNNPA